MYVHLHMYTYLYLTTHSESEYVCSLVFRWQEPGEREISVNENDGSRRLLPGHSDTFIQTSWSDTVYGYTCL